MRYLKKFESVETDNEFIVAKIVDNFPFEEVKSKIEDENDETDKHTTLIDMINWFEHQFGEIDNEDYILDRLREEYDIH